jgi:hypothetical protein
VAATIIGNNQETEIQKRDIVLYPYEGGVQRISEIHPSYIPLHYVLMFPRGEDGWHPKIPIYNNESLNIDDENISEDNDEDEANESSKYISAMNYFAYRLQVGRSEEALTLHLYGRLFQQ